jgi:hypothetical protein
MKTPKQSSNLKALRDEYKRIGRKDEPRDLVNPRGSQLGENIENSKKEYE